MSDIDERIASATLPTDRTLRMRSSLPVQAWRFAKINLRMVRMIRRGHAPLGSPDPAAVEEGNVSSRSNDLESQTRQAG